MLQVMIFKVLPSKESSSSLVIHEDDEENISQLFNKIQSSSNEISGSVFIPIGPNNEKYVQNHEKIFKFNDLQHE